MSGMFDTSLRAGDAIELAASTLEQSDELGRSSRADAALLLRHVLCISQAELYAYKERPLTRPQIRQYNALVTERLQGRPIQYITGQQEFFGLPFRVTPDVLIPRPETEHLVEAAIARLHTYAAPRIVDVGTGSGAIAIALAHAMPHSHIVALDISPAALAIAEQNAQTNGIAKRIRFIESDLLAAVAGERFDAVISNPPYVALSERATLAKEVREYEPALALFAGATGFEIYERLIAEASAALDSNGWLLMEIGHGQKNSIANLLQNWNAVEFIPDLQGIPRVVLGRKSKAA